MQEQNAKLLIDKYQSGACSPEEQAIVENWLTLGIAAKQDLAPAELEEDLIELRNRISRIPRKKIIGWPRIAAVAAAVTFLAIGTYLYTVQDPTDQSIATKDLLSYANDVAPGKNTATLTLANGKTITLSDKKSGVVVGTTHITYSDGSSLRAGMTRQSHDEVGSSANLQENASLSPITRNDGMVQTMTAATPKGGTYQITLPDGTHVWLNADSKISFPSQFNGKERRIMLSGEAYFEVIHNAKMPFRVESKSQVVEDIGTAFNINAYADEANVKTTLIEGSASVKSAGARRSVVLKPEQQSVFTDNGSIAVKTIDPATVIDWKKGEFRFKNEPLPSIMRKLARWYNITIVYDSGEYADVTFTGSVSRFDKVSAVLRLLEKTEDVKFKIADQKVTVMPYK